MSHYLSGAWSKKYFILLREGDKPKAFYYNKKPKNFLDSQKGFFDVKLNARLLISLADEP